MQTPPFKQGNTHNGGDSNAAGRVWAWPPVQDEDNRTTEMQRSYLFILEDYILSESLVKNERATDIEQTSTVQPLIDYIMGIQ